MSALRPRPGDAAARAPGALLLEALLHPRDGHDELHRADGAPRACWQRFFDWLSAEPAAARAEIDALARQLAQQIRADGITHNVYGADADARAPARPWPLEVLPLIVEPDDWAVIERGIVQRARLLNATMADLYGPQRLLREALLPATLLYRHPGYLRALHGALPPGALFLHIVAFDLARGPDGHWWVVAQRCENPSGLGYVLHNRLVVSRLFPEAFRELRVQHIASAYRRLLDTVEAQAAAVAGAATPRVALLTSGPYSETYFEHAYLARYLGVPLVEGGDLTVRDDRVYLKTVEGLEPVHALLRRLDDQWADPLELRSDSTLGVPGLVQALRAGGVVVANALGSACLETPALQGFLPAISQALLGEELAMPSLPTWWCGEAAAWHAVRGALDDKVVRHTFPKSVSPPGPATVERIEDDADAWTVQGRLEFSRAPLWRGGTIHTRAAGLRVYAIADGRGRWHALPGGMTRVAAGVPTTVSMRRGGTSLDTWVLTDGPVDLFTMLPQRLSVEHILARRRPVASRTAENLFWLGRYTERTEQLVRLARATLVLIDGDCDAPPPLFDALSVLARQCGLAPAGVPSLTRAPAVFERSVLAALTDRAGATSVGYNLAALARAAGSLRERLSSEHWGLVQAMADDLDAALAAPPAAATDAQDLLARAVPSFATALPALDRLAVQLAAVTGAQSDRMTRDHGWRLLTVGRFIERLVGLGQAFGTLIDLGAGDSEAGLDLLLELFDSTITYRARYQRHQDLLAVVDTLVLHEANPRAFAGVLRRLRIELRKLPGPESLLDGWVARLPAEGAGITLDDLRDAGWRDDDAALRSRLRTLVHTLADAGMRLSDDLGGHFFAHADADVLQRV